MVGVDPVSYTHLDVYKRQLVAPLSKKKNGSFFIKSKKFERGVTVEYKKKRTLKCRIEYWKGKGRK